MLRVLVRSLPLAGVFLFPSVSVDAQGVTGESTPRKLSGSPAEFASTFSTVKSVRALPDGRLVVPDSKEKEIVLIDFDKGTRKTLARTGSGPREFQALGGVYRAKGGGLLVYDAQQKRFLPIKPDGSIEDVKVVPEQSNGTFMMMGSGPDQYTPDTLGAPFGNLYTKPFGRPTPGAPAPDSSALVRMNQTGTRSDTVAMLKQPETKAVEMGPGMVARMGITFSPSDGFAVAPDGSLAIIRATPYHAEWIPAKGPMVRGPNVTYTPVKVTAAEKDSIKTASASRGRGGSSGGGSSGGFRIGDGRGGTQNISIPSMEPVILDTKPAFVQTSAIIDELSRVWVERYQPFGKSTVLYDVFDRKGVLVDRIEFPARTRVVGFDATSIYAVHTDEDDLLHLLRYRSSTAERGGK